MKMVNATVENIKTFFVAYASTGIVEIRYNAGKKSYSVTFMR